MAIKTGDRLPEATFTQMTADGPTQVTTADVFGGRKVALFAVPGAFTPTCHRNHLPGFLENADAISAKGVDAIACVAVNDVFVMDAWARAAGAEGRIEFLADGNGDFARALGLEVDLGKVGLGVRSQRYAMLVDDGTVKVLNVEPSPGDAEASSAAALLESL